MHEALYNIRSNWNRKSARPRASLRTSLHHLVAHPEALPRGYQERMGDEKLARVVCDYIAGMTDHYIEDLRKKLITKKTV